jgi:hypothetical protein
VEWRFGESEVGGKVTTLEVSDKKKRETERKGFLEGEING